MIVPNISVLRSSILSWILGSYSVELNRNLADRVVQPMPSGVSDMDLSGAKRKYLKDG